MENLKQFAKVSDDPKKRRKLVRKKVPDGMVPWREATMNRLIEAAGGADQQHAGDDRDDPGRRRPARGPVRRHAAAADREPRAAEEAAEADPRGDRHRPVAAAGRRPGAAREAEPDGRRYGLTLDLPPDFALNQPLSTFALAAIDLLDPNDETYVVDVVSVIEATLDDPRQILAAQLNKAKGEAVRR